MALHRHTYKYFSYIYSKSYILKLRTYQIFRQISGALIRISNCEDRNSNENVDRTITITGNSESVAVAQYLINMRWASQYSANVIKFVQDCQVFSANVFHSRLISSIKPCQKVVQIYLKYLKIPSSHEFEFCTGNHRENFYQSVFIRKPHSSFYKCSIVEINITLVWWISPQFESSQICNISKSFWLWVDWMISTTWQSWFIYFWT